jgi:hypothetical protein
LEDYIEHKLKEEVIEQLREFVITLMIDLENMSHKQAKVTYHKKSEAYIEKYKNKIKEYLEEESCKNEKDSLLESLEMTTKEGFKMFFMGTTKKEELKITEERVLKIIEEIENDDIPEEDKITNEDIEKVLKKTTNLEDISEKEMLRALSKDEK